MEEWRKVYGVFGSVTVIHEYQKVPPKSYTQGVPAEEISTKVEKAGLATHRDVGMCPREFRRKYGRRDYSNVMSFDPVNNSWRSLRVQGKKAELQRRAVHLKTTPIEKIKHSRKRMLITPRTMKQIALRVLKNSGTKGEISSCFTLQHITTSSAHKLSQRVSLVGGLFQRPLLRKNTWLEARSSSLIEKELNNLQSANRSDKSPEALEALVHASTFNRRRRTKSAVAIGNKPNLKFCSSFFYSYEDYLVKRFNENVTNVKVFSFIQICTFELLRMNYQQITSCPALAITDTDVHQVSFTRRRFVKILALQRKLLKTLVLNLNIFLSNHLTLKEYQHRLNVSIVI